jgi:hypothetical protein
MGSSTHVVLAARAWGQSKIAPGMNTVPVQLTGGNVNYGTTGASCATIFTTTKITQVIGVVATPLANSGFCVEIVDDAGTPNVFAQTAACGTAAPSDSQPAICQSGPIPVGTAIRARCSSSVAGATICLRIIYVEVE